MISFLSGNDWFRVHDEVKKLQEDFLVRFPSAETFSLWATDCATHLSLVRDALSGGLFATPASILIRLDEEISDALKTQLRSVLEPALLREDSLVVVTVSLKFKKSDILCGWLSQSAKPLIYNQLQGAALEHYAEKLLSRIDPHKRLAKDALRQIVINTHGESGRLLLELTKLSLFSDTETITLDEVRALSQEPLESNAFDALDALVRGDRERAIALLRKEEKQGVPVERTLGLLAWQLRRLIEMQELFQKGVQTASAIARDLGMKSDFTVRKALPALARFPLARLKRGMGLLADLDLATKTGMTTPGVGLDLFVWKF